MLIHTVVSFPPIIIIIMYFLCFLGSRDFRVLVGHEILSPSLFYFAWRCFDLLFSSFAKLFGGQLLRCTVGFVFELV